MSTLPTFLPEPSHLAKEKQVGAPPGAGEGHPHTPLQLLLHLGARGHRQRHLGLHGRTLVEVSPDSPGWGDSTTLLEGHVGIVFGPESRPKSRLVFPLAGDAG